MAAKVLTTTEGSPVVTNRTILLLSTVWPARALLRAQLIESGLQVLATDSWAAAREQMLRLGLPHLFIVDLQGLPEAESVLRELGSIVPPERVLVLAAIAAAAARESGADFRVLRRPFSIGTVVDTVAQMLDAQRQTGSSESG